MREAPEAAVVTQERLRSLQGRDPMAATRLSVVSSLPPFEEAPDPEARAAMEKVASAKVKAWRKAGKQEKEKEPMKAYPMFGTTWGEGFEAPYGEISATRSNDSLEWEVDWRAYPVVAFQAKTTFASWGVPRTRARGDRFTFTYGCP